MPEPRDAYEVLQVAPSAELIVIQAAYRALARRYHPDGDGPDVDRMSELNQAYNVLRDPPLREKYDAERAATRTRAVPITEPQAAQAAKPAPGWSHSAVQDKAVLDFGRYQGWSIHDIARRDPDYLRWLARHSSGIRFRSAIAAALPKDPDLHRDRSSVA